MRELTCKELDAVAGGLDLPTGEAVKLPGLAELKAPPSAPPRIRVRPIPGEPRPA
jgi:hypothetical protein